MGVNEMMMFMMAEAGLLIVLPCLVWTVARVFKLGRFRNDGLCSADADRSNVVRF